MRRLWHRHPYLVAAFVVAVALSALFAGRIIWGMVYWAQNREVQVQPWMTVRYVARSWRLDPRAIDSITGLPGPEDGRPQTLEQIAAARGVPVTQIVAEVEAAIALLHAARPEKPQP